MFSPRFSRAVTAAFYCFVAQLFLSLSAILFATAVFAIVDSNLGVIVIAPVAGFVAYVGITALQRARQLVAGTGPLL